jgi:hypothetical protein
MSWPTESPPPAIVVVRSGTVADKSPLLKHPMGHRLTLCLQKIPQRLFQNSKPVIAGCCWVDPFREHPGINKRCNCTRRPCAPLPCLIATQCHARRGAAPPACQHYHTGPCAPSPMYTMRAPTTPHSNSAPRAPRRRPPCMPALPFRPLQLAQRTCSAGTITRATIGQYGTTRTLSQHAGALGSHKLMALGTSPRYLAKSLLASKY